MARHDKAIEWLEKQRLQAVEALDDIKNGVRILINDEDMTYYWVEKHNKTIKDTDIYLAAYKRHE
jgi:hypothetical protein